MKKPTKNNNVIINPKTKGSGWKKLYYIIFGRTIPQKMLRFYLVVILVSAGLLYCPFSLTDGDYWVHNVDGIASSDHYYTFWDAIFISCSAFSDTGLTPFPTGGNFTFVGQLIILILIQFGGFGFMTILFLVWNMFRKWNNIDLNQIIILQAERGNEKYGNSYRSIRTSIIFVLLIELIFAFLMAFWLCWFPTHQQMAVCLKDGQYVPYDGSNLKIYVDTDNYLRTHNNFAIALWAGLFNSISSLNNAGFDIFSSGSLAPFRNDWNVVFQIMTMIEFIIGGIGFPLIFDVIEKIKYKHKGINYRLSLFTKVCLITYLLVSVFGLIFTYSFEYLDATINKNNLMLIVNLPNQVDVANVGMKQTFGQASDFNKNWCIFYNVMTTRSSGFNTIDQNMWSPGTKWTFIILMFIGASPSSTAGGIRTTTLAIIICALFAKILGKRRLVMFKRTISEYTVRDSFIVFVTSMAMILIISVIVYYSVLNSINNHGHHLDHTFTLFDCIFETSSAFGTVGLSTNITSSLGPSSMVGLILMMFVGQLGLSQTLLSWTKKHPKGNNVTYPTEEIKIG